MVDIKHKLVIKTSPEVVYDAVTTQQGLESWWAKATEAKPEIGSVNVFIFGTLRNEMLVTELVKNEFVDWKVIVSIDEWVGTRLTFDLEEKDGKTILRFTHAGWEASTDTYAECNYAWARFMNSLKSYCETGTGTPS
ncbi:SRPBCC family protein [Cytophaga aurantiaca]|uniref:SRPBCC family protein n=1 Tax=Cytophaga aurantiaca TaxID=29530 RepID=UPI00037A473B|nr:SRPBCC domain-containing protein [Cytophaga aurantiaca]